MNERIFTDTTETSTAQSAHFSQVLLQRQLQRLRNFLQLRFFFLTDTVLVSDIQTQAQHINCIIST